MSYTIRNLRDAEDMAPKFGFDAVQEARFPWRDLGAEHTGLALMRVKPGQRQAFAHRHDEAEEIYVILSGRGRIKLDDEVREVGPMDAIRISPHVTRALEAGDEGLEYLAFGPHRENDGEILREERFWDEMPD
ncbi:MAG TPA: cupin domain-containing protein [Baekduia sp.]|nr:cupin domain-containing protein [Baekduia sp.]